MYVTHHTLVSARRLDRHANIHGAERGLNVITAGLCPHSDNFMSHLPDTHNNTDSFKMNFVLNMNCERVTNLDRMEMTVVYK
jgi:hypothetical protein